MKVKAIGWTVETGALIPVPTTRDVPGKVATAVAGELMMVVAPILVPPANVTAAVRPARF